MSEIRQSDIFVFLTDKKLFRNPSYTQLYIATKLNVLKGGTGNKISDIIRGKDDGLENLKPDDIYVQFFMPMENDGEHFRRLKNAVKNGIKPRKGRKERKGPLTFDGWEGRESDTYHDYVIRMLKEALPRWEKPSEDEQQASGADSPEYPLENDYFSHLEAFTGREELVEDIQKCLDGDGCVALIGIGGIGKSTLAKEFAAQNKKPYSPIQLVSGKEASSFKEVVLKLRFEGLKGEPEDVNRRYGTKKELLKRLNERTLLIIDNVDEAWEDVEKFYDIRHMMKFRLIITSRLSLFSRLPSLTVEKLPTLEEQRKLFFHHYGDGESLNLMRLDELLNRIEGHTLLIELIAKTMYQESVTVEDMLEWLDNPKSDPTLDYKYIDDDGKSKKPKEVIRTMLFRVKMNDEQKELLYRLTFLPHEGVSRTLLLKTLKGLCRSRASELLGFLETRAWVMREGGQNRIHPVIREAVRKDIPPEWWEWDVHRHREFLKNIRETMETEGLDEKSQISLCLLAWNVCKALHEEHKAPVPLALWGDLLEIAKRCKAAHQYETAKLLCKLLDGIKIKKGAKSEERVDLLLELGSIHQHWGNYGKARKLYEQALEETQKDDDRRGSCYKSLGVACRKDAYYEEAEEYFKKALNCYGRKDLIVPVLYDLGILTAPDGSGVVTALDAPGVITALDDLDREVITAQDDLGHVYRHLGEAATEREEIKIAEDYYQTAKRIAEAVLELRKKWGEDAKELAVSHHRIGSACYCLGGYKRARDEHVKAEELRPGIAASYHWIGKDYLKLGNLDEAKKNLEKSLRLRKDHLLKDHPDVAKSLMSLGEYYETIGDLEKAIEKTQEAYDIRANPEKGLRHGHPYTEQAKRRLEELEEKRKKQAPVPPGQE